MGLLQILKSDFRVNKRFNQRLFLFIVRGNTYNWPKGILYSLIRVFFKIWNSLFSIAFNSEVPSSVNIGSGLRVPHPYNIIIKKTLQ